MIPNQVIDRRLIERAVPLQGELRQFGRVLHVDVDLAVGTGRNVTWTAQQRDHRAEHQKPIQVASHLSLHLPTRTESEVSKAT